MRIRFLAAGTLTAALAATASAQTGTQFTISDGDVFFTQRNSPTTTTLAPANNLTDFRVNGAAGTDHVYGNWWWWRTGTSEVAVNTVATVAAGNTATQTFTGTGFTGSMQWVVADTGTSLGQVTETMTITNTGAAPLVISLFNYADYYVNGADAGDTATQAGDTITVTDTAIFQHRGIGGNAWQVTPFSAGLVNSFGDAAATNLNNTITGSPGDILGAWQWNLTIPVGGQASVVGRIAIVPEPATVALLGLGALALIRRR